MMLASPSPLTSAEQYRLDVRQFPRITPEQEDALIARARAGEDVRQDILLSLQERIMALAHRFVQQILPSRRVEWLEFIQAANMAILDNFQKALAKERPYPYFVGIARMAMRNCINGYGDLIKTHNQMENIVPLSLDAPLEDDGEPTTLGALLAAAPLRLPEPGETDQGPPPSTYELLVRGNVFSHALTLLTESQRKVMACVYGLDGQSAARNWTEAGQILGISEGAVSTHHRRACTRLRGILLNSSPAGDTALPGVYTSQQAYEVLGARDRKHFSKLIRAYNIQPCAPRFYRREEIDAVALELSKKRQAREQAECGREQKNRENRRVWMARYRAKKRAERQAAALSA